MTEQHPRRAWRFVGGYLLLSCLFAAAVLVLCWCAQRWIGILPEAADADTPVQEKPCIILDAGHGGEDGGAVGVTGLLEKNVNLRLAELLCGQLKLAGIPTVMTRTEDRMLYDPTADYRGRKKMLDLRARLDIVKETPGAVLVSIHQNFFGQSQYSGLQVYYSPHAPDSLRLAELVQGAAQRWLQPRNSRSVKAADSSIYLLHRCESPAILVECGFLSNPEECARLADDTYLRELSTMLFAAICEYLSAESSGA